MVNIAIDAGHGYYTPGKRCLKSIDPKETHEWVLNSRIADKVQSLLDDYECETMRVDDVTGETDVTLLTRVTEANKWADVYVSIHHNAGINGGSGGGIVVFCAREASDTARRLQKAVYERTAANTGLVGNRSNPTPEKDLYVLRKTTIPAVLGEFGFMDSSHDTPIILTEEFADNVARGIVEALVDVYGLEDKMTDEKFNELMQRWLAAQGDKPADEWAKSHIDEAVAMGITDGSEPQRLATRQEVMTMVKNAVKE